MPGYLAAADFGVHFIRPGICMIANSPTKFAEYLASGLPILTNAGIGDSDEILQQENVGVTVDGFEPAAYSRRWPPSRACCWTRSGTACRAAAERRFSLHTVGGGGYSRVYRALGWSAAPV